MRNHGWIHVFLAATLVWVSVEAVGPKEARGESFAPGRVSFTARYKGEESSYRVNGISVLPGEDLSLELAPARASFALTSSEGSFRQTAPGRWIWKAPSRAGLYPTRIRREPSGEEMLLNVFVVVPSTELRGERLNDYRIGTYPAVPLNNLPIYRAPDGFVEVTKDNQDAYVAPHFQLKQFLCKQETSRYPLYVVMRERLFLKLEALLELANERGYRADTLHVMSGYRTPFYNQAIGNVPYSRHVYGGAADVFIDVDPEDGVMDDLNRDGRVDDGDTHLLAKLVEELERQPFHSRLIGGLARYASNRVHGPFLHIDVRGAPARWGVRGAMDEQ